jgi:hypothetical protein
MLNVCIVLTIIRGFVNNRMCHMLLDALDTLLLIVLCRIQTIHIFICIQIRIGSDVYMY